MPPATNSGNGGLLSLLQCGPASLLSCDGVPDECDFDINPTGLYVAVHTKQWGLAADRLKVFPAEASVWVSRFGDPVGLANIANTTNGVTSLPGTPTSAAMAEARRRPKVLRWKMLPLHGAVLFGAPLELVHALIKAYPAACSCVDDQGMLPLHLAFRCGAKEAVVLELLDVYPQAIEIEDKKGRVPSVLALKDAVSYVDTIGEAFLKGPSYYYYAARVAASDRVRNESEMAAKVRKLEEERKAEYESTKNLLTKTQAELQEDIEVLSTENAELKERLAWYETKYDGAEEKEKVLVDHTNSLAERLRLTSLSEEHLATKLAKLEAKLKSSEAEIQNLRNSSAQQKGDLENDVRNLTEALESTQLRADLLTDKLQKKIMELNETKLRFEKERKLFEKQIDASKECLMELISSSKEDKKMFDEDNKELRRQLLIIQSELQKTSQIPRSLEDRLDSLQKEVMSTRSFVSKPETRSVANDTETMAKTQTKKDYDFTPQVSVRRENRHDNSFDYYVSTTSSHRDVGNNSYQDSVDARDDGHGGVSFDGSNLSDVDTAIALGDLTDEQREALESLDLTGGKDEIAETLSRVPGLTKKQVSLLVDVASSLAG
eukprot:CAMPEP_0171354830 /NCGR_PEP_ID=MMETSP0878-20121228/44911_1 /TAXON_ID=67004 /ORGANISM="Thalassiosira weissflogii, Strain CCMP1336" /LENGTH=604 /DNA_ID=CAMNT_0011860817 /DNA_START=133 /DNA_END=1947 /DNA_ORIENTATION=+